MQTEKKSFFSKLTDIVVTKEDDIPLKSAAKPAGKVVGVTPTAAPIVPAYIPPPITVKASVSDSRVQGFKQTLEAAIQEKALGNFDYLRLKNAAAELQAYIPREQDRLNAAFKSARSGNNTVTKQKILDSTTHYLGVLEQEKQDFDASVEANNQEKVVKVEQQIQAADESLAQKQDQIKQLMDEVNEIHKQKMDLDTALNEGKALIAESSNSFATAYNLVVNDINNDIQKINSSITE